MKTAMAAMLLFGFIIFGLDLLLSILGFKSLTNCKERHLASAREFFDERNQYERGTFEYDYLNASYRKHLSKSIISSKKDC